MSRPKLIQFLPLSISQNSDQLSNTDNNLENMDDHCFTNYIKSDDNEFIAELDNSNIKQIKLSDNDAGPGWWKSGLICYLRMENNNVEILGIIVDEKYRCQGIAKRCFLFISKLTNKNIIGTIRPDDNFDWNELINVYLSIGCVVKHTLEKKNDEIDDKWTFKYKPRN